MAETIETRPFPPFLPKNTTVDDDGDIPANFRKAFYGISLSLTFKNDMWRVYGLVFFDDRNTLEKVRKSL